MLLVLSTMLDTATGINSSRMQAHTLGKHQLAASKGEVTTEEWQSGPLARNVTEEVRCSVFFFDKCE